MIRNGPALWLGEEFGGAPPESAEIDHADAADHRGGIMIEQRRRGLQKVIRSFGSFGTGFRQASKRFLSLSESDGIADFIKSLHEKDM